MEEIERDEGHSEIEEQKQLFDFCYKKKNAPIVVT